MLATQTRTQFGSVAIEEVREVCCAGIQTHRTETRAEKRAHLEGHNRGHMLDQGRNLEHHVRGTSVLLHLTVHLLHPGKTTKAKRKSTKVKRAYKRRIKTPPRIVSKRKKK